MWCGICDGCDTLTPGGKLQTVVDAEGLESDLCPVCVEKEGYTSCLCCGYLIHPDCLVEDTDGNILCKWCYGGEATDASSLG